MYLHRYNTRSHPRNITDMSKTSEDNVDSNADKIQKYACTKTESSSKGLNLDSDASVSGLAWSSVVLPADATMILRPGERFNQRFTKENPVRWFKYFEPLCFRNGLRSDNQKIDGLM